MNPRLALVGVLLCLASCAAPEEPPPKPAHTREDWVLESHVAFFEADAKTPRDGPARGLRLWMPYVVGDIYGAPNAGELASATFNPDLSFVLDLNKSYDNLAKELIPTEFSQKWMIIEPASARIARLSAFVLPTDGIVPVGLTEWIDADSRARLMLVYLDRPARLRGEVVHEGRNLRFDITATEAGYLWIQQPERNGVYRKATPKRVILAVMPD